MASLNNSLAIRDAEVSNDNIRWVFDNHCICDCPWINTVYSEFFRRLEAEGRMSIPMTLYDCHRVDERQWYLDGTYNSLKFDCYHASTDYNNWNRLYTFVFDDAEIWGFSQYMDRFIFWLEVKSFRVELRSHMLPVVSHRLLWRQTSSDRMFPYRRPVQRLTTSANKVNWRQDGF